ncbi:OB-fold domain-containing protein [Micromonospora sp. NPDC047074]|uniref:Zn-ribbon domain-containing OB-fold protein n=1 Tax=Micromonospora sp. NPDC047074 TaxID=3154339 RepID=UPI0033D29B19
MSAPADVPATAYQPVLAAEGVHGSRCTRCRRGAAPATPRCPWCGATAEGETFAPSGTVWAATVVHIDVGARQPPYGLAYVDLDDGPRVLVLLRRPEALTGGTRVTLAATDDPAAWAVADREVTP